VKPFPDRRAHRPSSSRQRLTSSSLGVGLAFALARTHDRLRFQNLGLAAAEVPIRLRAKRYPERLRFADGLIGERLMVGFHPGAGIVITPRLQPRLNSW
jgi:hypothetical protein